MASQRRLSLEQASEYSLPSSEHLQRYEFVVPLVEGLRVLDLCCGVGYGADIMAATARSVVGVDRDGATGDAAEATYGSDRVRFVAADAVEYLERDLAADFDAIVCFEGLEHLPDQDRVFAALTRQVERGVALAASVPNSKTLEDSDEFHLADYDRAAVAERFGGFEGAVVLEQFVAEGSLIRRQGGEGLAVDLRGEDRAEEDYANNFLVFVGLAAPEALASARLHLTLQPSHNRYMRSLELANANLRKANARLGRNLMGSSGSAAAATLAKLQAEAAQAREGREYAETLAREGFDREADLRRQLERQRLRNLIRRLVRGLRPQRSPKRGASRRWSLGRRRSSTALGKATDGELSIPLASLPLAFVHQSLPHDAPFSSRQSVEVAETAMPAFVAHAPMSLAWRLQLPPRVRLRTHVALLETAWEQNSGGVVFTVDVTDFDGEVLESSSLTLDPSARPEDRSWRDFELGLSGRRGAEVMLRLSTDVPEGAGGEAAWSVWGRPELIVPDGDVARPGGERRDAGTQAAPIRAAAEGPATDASRAPLISVITPAHDPDPEHLRRAVGSVLAQTHERWELCLADDGSTDHEVRRALEGWAAQDERVKLVRGDQAGIAAASNAALELATGEYVAFLDHDDELAPEALLRVAEAIARDPDADIIHTDHDHLDGGIRRAPLLKPSWSPELLEACMYLGHLTVFRRELVQGLGGLSSEFDGSQDHDLALRASERTERVLRVPGVLYHWRLHADSGSYGGEVKPWAREAGLRAVRAHLERTGADADAELTDEMTYRLRFPDLGSRVAAIVYVSSEEAESQGFIERVSATKDGLHRALPGAEVIVATADAGESRAATVNRAASEAGGEVLLLALELGRALSATGEPAEPEWGNRLAGYALRPGVGAAGPALETDAGRVGLEPRLDRAAVHLLDGMPAGASPGAGHPRPLRFRCAGNVLALDGVLATTRACFERLGGLTDEFEGLEAVDYCLRAHEAGLRNVLAPDSRWRGFAESPLPLVALPGRVAFRRHWLPRIPEDPYYHPHSRSDAATFEPTAARYADQAELAARLTPDWPS